MSRNFPLFNSSLDLAHSYWERLLRPGDWAIDATCGNGHDTLKLIQTKEIGGVIGIDIQPEALRSTRALLGEQPHVHLYCQSHAEFPPLAYERPIRLVVYNLGYLPGGNKQMTTMTQTTLDSVQRALELILPGGAVSITCYPGHPEGRREEEALLAMAGKLHPNDLSVNYLTFHNRTLSPSLLFIQKNDLLK